MSRASVESDDGVLSRDQVNSPMVDRGKHGGSSDGVVLKKGPWTSAEDAILMEYVNKHGEGNWNAVQKYSGLSRCGKSCRLRWANHLRPNLKKGAFSAEEERTIVELHAKMGNKWARMAAQLHGRTDNEIKNYWNTRIKRRLRAGLPLYPAELCMQSVQDCQQGLSHHGMNFGNKGDNLQTSSYQIPDVVFDDLKSGSSILPYVPKLTDVSASNFLMKTLASSQYVGLLPPAMYPTKRVKLSTLYPGYAASAKDSFSPFHQYEDDTCEKIARSFAYTFPVDDPTDKNPLSFGGVHGSHSLCNSSTSKPIEALKMELPSLQYPDPNLGSWDTSSHSPPRLFESVDKFFQSPPVTGNVEESDSPPYNNGLLESLVYEAKTMSSAKNPLPDKSLTSSTALTPGGGDINSSTTLDVCKSEWEEYGDPFSPSGHSATSIFDKHTSFNPTLDEQLPVLNVKEEPIHRIQTPEVDEAHYGDLSFSDAFLASSDCFGLNCGATFEDAEAAAAMTDPLESILLGDLSSDSRPSSTTDDAYMNLQECGFYAWNSMPSVCQMSELQ